MGESADMTELENELCDHRHAYLNKACCSPLEKGDQGFVECGCNGLDSITCPNPHCQGIDDWEIDPLWERVLEGARYGRHD